ncbi:2Fe-2S iron-sulfur cluster-binding protein [Streptomyces sp. H10-C2]|uniref:(2Fe-2S)-binding protein n=1 Tax=unclassified Streptomyces TaxID=2593676 RepID=UPI0024B94A9E|nr:MULTISPECIES: 2Fe-2S iron-sulfur cluster-binding protein [unclassified Streptomyces]MDJ0344372.1 2Fe-2S iron-sulfur cluster-binding protein [Streptomyces sp. PH10-H1]MDJ0373741.1 2Fe-2S iron-sulfur cluster-binding protein [Streptomyces sp. H10-C2]
MTDQPQPQPGTPGTWQPVPGGGDYDPDQTMHVSFAAQLPPLAGAADAATQWSIPLVAADPVDESGEYPVGSVADGFTAPWTGPHPDETHSRPDVPSPRPFSAGQFGQGAAAFAAMPPAAVGEHPAGDRPSPYEAVPPGTPGVHAADEHASRPPGAQDPAARHPYFAEHPPSTGAGAPRPEPSSGETGQWSLPFVAEDAADESGEYSVGTIAGAESAVVTEDEPETDAETSGAGHTDPAEDTEDAEEPELEEAHSEHPLASYVLRVNGADRPVTDAWLGESLLYVLRERLGLAGAKDGCEQGECGACSVQVDGRLVASCLVPAATAAGSEVRTVEGLSDDGQPSDVQRALAECGAVQCGFCVPGLAMTVHDLLEGNHKPTELETRQAICGNLCRCTGYRGVLDAVQDVVAAREAAAAEPAEPGADGPRVPHQGIPRQSGPHGGQPGGTA